MNRVTDIVLAAIAYATAKWKVFPLAPAGKVPAIAGGRGLLDATTDPDEVKRLWSDRPTANVGIVVPDHLLVIDVDPLTSGDDPSGSTHGDLQRRPTVQSQPLDERAIAYAPPHHSANLRL